MRLPFLASVAMVLFLANGCGSPPPKTPAKHADAADAAAKPAAAPGASPDRPVETYSYSAIGKRDPFRSPLDDLIISHGNEAQCPLCKWEIDQLKLVAVVTGTGNPVAMVEDPDGVGHLVRVNTEVGRLAGRVTAIRRDQLVITEAGHDSFGRVVANKLILKIEHPEQNAIPVTSLLDE
jgi:type IV pilus assembly protein PilP